jgi:predicted ATPase/class 3 adenylate cyclase
MSSRTLMSRAKRDGPIVTSAAIVFTEGEGRAKIERVSSRPTGTVTFLFTDIEGSTRLWERNPEAMQQALARHDEILRDVIEQHGGYDFKTVGDAFCCAFSTASDALEAALVAQRALLGAKWGDTGPLRVRMTLHTGATEERDGDYFGPPLNRVARLLSAGHGGQVLLSAAAQEMVRDQLPAGTGLRDLGELRLKDLFRPERVFQLVASDLPSEFPPLRTLDYYRNNLPIQPTPLVGREKEVAEVCEWLSRPEVRLLTLTGAGGTGKTRLALQAAAELTEEFEEGVFFVSLAAISDPELVVGAVAGTLGVKEMGGRPVLETLTDYLREKQLLLILDNFEQVLEAAPIVSELLSAAPNLKVLATSRIPLRLYGEHEYSVPSLALPDLQRAPSGERLTQYEAVRLFIERAQAAKADFSVTNDNALAVAQICHRLDGLPLAIELAAARIKLLTPQAMLARLGNRLKLLTGGARDLPERQRTLRATLEWSHALLEWDERALFGRLSVFARGRTLEAIEAVCDPEGDLAVEVLDGVGSLVDKSLLRQEEGVGGEPRFVMLETVHEFAREKLEESGEGEKVRRRHAAFFLAFAEGVEPRLWGPEDTMWLHRLEAELDNMREALSWALERGEAELGLRLAAALWRFWEARGYYDEGRRWLEDALEKKGRASASVRAKALMAVAWLAHAQVDVDRAEAAAQEGLKLSDEVEIGSSLAASFRILLGIAARIRGDYERAKDLVKESLKLSQEAHDKLGIAHALLELGNASDSWYEAKEFYEEAITLCREVGYAVRLADILGSLGYISLLEGDYARAVELNEEAAALRREHGYKGRLEFDLDNLGWAALLQGDHERARTSFEDSLTLCKELGEKMIASESLEGLACVAAAEGESERAARLFGAAESLREAVGYQHDPEEDALREPYLAMVRSRLDDASWEGAWAEGRGTTFDEAISYALEEVERA